MNEPKTTVELPWTPDELAALQRCSVQGRHCGDATCTKFHGATSPLLREPYTGSAEQERLLSAMGTTLDNDPPRCNQCGREPPTHARDCPKLDGKWCVEETRPPREKPLRNAVYETLTSGRVASALSELAGMGSDICALLDGVQHGATLVITGPDPLGRKGAPHFAATIESSTGAREAHAVGSDLFRLLNELASTWVASA